MRRCKAIVSSLEPGFSGLLSGLSMLAAAGELHYSESFATTAGPSEKLPWHLRSRGQASMALIFDERIRCHIDVHDSWEIDSCAYEMSTLYFKRSYDPARLRPQDFPRLRPLGLIYEVRRNGIDLRELRRIATIDPERRGRLLALWKCSVASLASYFDAGPRTNLSMMHAAPDPALEPSVLFIVRLWDPAAVPADRPDKAAEFEALNEMRANCIRRLRSEFGRYFTGGVTHSEFARRRYPDVLLDDPGAASKRSYIRKVRRSAVCVATTGLHGSNGWKLAEYVALSRAIVSEPLCYAVPGDFRDPLNYLAFRSADQCADQVHRLINDPELRLGQMHANHVYYSQHMRPDSLARYILESATGG